MNIYANFLFGAILTCGTTSLLGVDAEVRSQVPLLYQSLCLSFVLLPSTLEVLLRKNVYVGRETFSSCR